MGAVREYFFTLGILAVSKSIIEAKHVKFFMEVDHKHTCTWDLRSSGVLVCLTLEYEADGLSRNVDEDCKRRWRSIKDTYKRLIREGKLSAEAASSSRRCKWPLLNVLTFLNVVPGRKRTQASADSMQYEDTVKCENDVNGSESWDPYPLPASPTSSVASAFSSQSSKKIKNNEQVAYLPNKNKANHQKVIYVTSSCARKEDEIDLFYRSIALTVKRLPPHLIAEVKLQHLKTVTEMQPRFYHEEDREEQYFQHLTQELKFSHTLQQNPVMHTVHISNTDREEDSITSDM